MEAGFALEPLAGETEGDTRSGRGFDLAEGCVAGLQDLGACAIGREDRAADMIGADEVDFVALDHGDGRALQPDIFAEERGGAVERVDLVFRDPVAVEIMDGMDRLGILGQAPDDLLAKRALELMIDGGTAATSV